MSTRLGSLIGLAALLTLAFVALVAEPAGACSCVGGTDEEQFARADAVFTGRLLDRKDPGMSSGGSSADFSSLRFEVGDVHKGEVPVDQAVVTEVSGGSCGLEIEGEGPFLVFAHRTHWDQEVPDGMLYAGLCDGTRPLAEAPVPAAFGTARAPVAPPDGAAPAVTAPSPGEDDAYLFFIGGLVAVVLVIGGAIVLLNRRTAASRVA